jgi:glycosyltransferase involved in cell wall biosynthesis
VVKKYKILFYSSVTDLKLFDITGFYLYDIKALESSGYDVIRTNSFKSFFKFWTYDISFLYFYKKSLIPGLISLFFNKKIIYTGGIDELSYDVEINRLKRFIYKVLFFLNYLISNFCNIVSTQDLKNTKNLLNSIGVKNCNKLVYFPHCIETENIQSSKLLNKENIFTTICWMGSIQNIKRKGVDKSLEIFKTFLSLNSDFKFYIIGTPGEGAVYLKNLVNRLDLSKNVFFTGSISESDKIELLQKSFFYFQISKYEGFGLAVLEAMISENIIIHSGKGGLVDTIADNGILVNNFDSIYATVELIDNIYKNARFFSHKLEMNKLLVKSKFNITERAFNFNKIIHEDKY